MKRHLLLVLFLLLVNSTAGADITSDIKNEVNPKCVEALKQCLVETDGIKEGCIGDASETAFCEDTLLGNIALKRSALSPTEPAFTGPAMVSKDCLANFDNKFSSILLKGTPTKEEIKALNDLLSKCEDSGNVLDNFKP